MNFEAKLEITSLEKRFQAETTPYSFLLSDIELQSVRSFWSRSRNTNLKRREEEGKSWQRWDSNPRPQRGLRPERSALDHSATLPTLWLLLLYNKILKSISKSKELAHAVSQKNQIHILILKTFNKFVNSKIQKLYFYLSLISKKNPCELSLSYWKIFIFRKTNSFLIDLFLRIFESFFWELIS